MILVLSGTKNWSHNLVGDQTQLICLLITKLQIPSLWEKKKKKKKCNWLMYNSSNILPKPFFLFVAGFVKLFTLNSEVQIRRSIVNVRSELLQRASSNQDRDRSPCLISRSRTKLQKKIIIRIRIIKKKTKGKKLFARPLDLPRCPPLLVCPD